MNVSIPSSALGLGVVLEDFLWLRGIALLLHGVIFLVIP